MNLKKLSFFTLIFLQICTFKLFSENVTFTTSQDIQSGNNLDPQIVTSSLGRFVYATTYQSSGRIRVLYSSDFGQTWTSADPTGVIFGDGALPQIKTDVSGQFVCLIFQGGTIATGPIKTFVSSDFGVTWTDTTDGSFGDGKRPMKITDSSAQYIYITWENTTDDIKVFASSDFGMTWTDTTDGSFGTGSIPQIITNSTGEFVYLTWVNTSNNIKTFVSSDFGQTWTDTTGPFAKGTSPQIITNSSGQFVYLTMKTTTDAILIFVSSDFGQTWTDVDPTGTIFGDGFNPEITTDNLGKYGYAIWREDTTDNIKIFFSQDFGATWNDVSESLDIFGDGFFPQITTDSSGRYTYAIWQKTSSDSAIKIFYSTDFGHTWTDADPLTSLFSIGSSPQITRDSIGRNAYGIWNSTGIDVTTGLRSFFPIHSLEIIK